ncbi:PREDICTED: uncharacterized protein LOC106809968 [Priapulus caudatus]|uniref:Uncharacterized protein LOC106809968 n=1 Tax=Priapulus caudatus TaxID=37621 RepID=A0ABM1E923_PRICU|nr:PREDICTED: uncharacterized protein LOC106809968 [Priapulus caudatus]
MQLPTCAATWRKETAQAIECDTCAQWFHCKCEGVSDATYEVIRDGNSGVAWYCRGCRRGVKKLSDMFKIMITRQIKTEENVEMLMATQVDMKSTMKELETKVDLLQNNSASATEIIRELNERERRQTSLMLFNVPESDEMVPADRVSHDTMELNKFITDKLQVEVPNVKQIIRVGAKNEDGAFRPMKATFEDKGDPSTLMQALKKLDFPTKKKLTIHLALDLTPMQREEGKILRAMRTQRQAELEKTGIKNFKWIILGDTLRKVRIPQENQ